MALAKIRASEHTLNGFMTFMPNDAVLRNNLIQRTDLHYVAGLLLQKVNNNQEHVLQLLNKEELIQVIKKFATTKGLVKKAEQFMDEYLHEQQLKTKEFYAQ